MCNVVYTHLLIIFSKIERKIYKFNNLPASSVYKNKNNIISSRQKQLFTRVFPIPTHFKCIERQQLEWRTERKRIFAVGTGGT